MMPRLLPDSLQTVDPVSDVLSRFAALADRIDARRGELAAILQRIESHETIEDEFFKSTDALRNANIEAPYFGRQVGTAASFLPLNLPLYSLVIFGVIPSAVAERMAVRAPTHLGRILAELDVVLQLGELFPRVHVSEASREVFVRDHAAGADLVIFTGKLANVQKLRPQLRRDALLLFSGRGVNPIVVGPDADLELAIAKTAHVKLFNSGQDCAAPDCVLVHASRSREFVAGLREVLARVEIGSYDAPEVRVGPLVEYDQLGLAAKQLAANCDNIVYGGQVDFKRGVVHPTLIFYPGFQKTNATELFSPVFFVTEYESEAQLEGYFQTPQYRENAMYVSLFGSSQVVESQRHSIVLRNTIVNETERGNLEYGGRSLGASFVQFGKEMRPQPILISREVSAHLKWRDKLEPQQGRPGNVVEEVHGGVTLYRVRGPLPGRHLLVLASTDGERSGIYACHRLLHELRSKKTRVDFGELTLVVPTSVGDVADEAALLAGLRDEADQVLVLRALPIPDAPFVVARDLSCEERESLAENVGVGRIVIDAALPNAEALVVQCGDDRDPSSSNVGYEVILNATRHLEIIGGAVRPAPSVSRTLAEVTALRSTDPTPLRAAPRGL
jgi:acyl-CoA reductase-like NAD-dependent aldehyde dehydrogenase